MAERQYVYRHIWPIVDDDRPLSALRAEAVAALDAFAARAGARLTGEPAWTVAGDRLMVEVQAEPAEGEQDQLDRAAAVRLMELGWSDEQVAEEFGWGIKPVAKLRRDAHVPAGAGVAELVDEVAVHRAAQGDRTVRLNRAEQNEAMELLRRRGATHREIGQRLDLPHGTVSKRLPPKRKKAAA